MPRPTFLSAIETQLRRWATNWLTADWPSCIYRPMGGKAYW